MTTSEFSYQFERSILEEALRSPSVAMMRLSIEMERQLRLILAATGQLQKYAGRSPIEALNLLAETVGEFSFPESLRGTLGTFWELRNDVIHGGRVREHLALRAVDYGIRILKMLHAIPRRSYIITHNAIPLFSDSQGRNQRLDVKGVMFTIVGPKGDVEVIKVSPTRRNYIAGQSVSWEWDLRGPGWDESWYLDPMTQKIEFAWSGSLEFIGRPLEEI